MISLRGLKRKIRSIKSIQQITRAMKMVSSIRLKNAREKAAFSENYSQDIQGLLSSLYIILKEKHPDTETMVLNPLMKKVNSNSIILVVITSDRGLCGGYNSNILRKTIDFIQNNKDKQIQLIVIGKKGRSAFARKSYFILKEYVNIFSNLQYADIENIGDLVVNHFLKNNTGEVFVIHSYFKSMLSQPVIVDRILPVTDFLSSCGLTTGSRLDDKKTSDTSVKPKYDEQSNYNKVCSPQDHIFEPDPQKLFELLMPDFVKSKLYKIITGSLVSEHAARMAAMESATKNAQDVIDKFTLQANKLRQEKITQELSELIASGI